MDSYIPEGFNPAQVIFERATKDIVNNGRIRAVIAAYEAALEDPKTVIPTALHAAIEALRRV